MEHKCGKCLDTGWIGYIPGHKTYPTDFAPCQECNKDEHIPSPFGSPTFTITELPAVEWEAYPCVNCGTLVEAVPQGIRCPKCGMSITWTTTSDYGGSSIGSPE